MRAVPTVQGTSAQKVLDAAARHGVDPELLLRAVRLERAAIADPEGRIPFRALVALYDEAARRTGDAAFGLHVGAASHPRMFDALGHAALASRTLRDAFRQILRFYRVLQEGATLELAPAAPHARVRYTITDASVAASCRHEVEATLAIVHRFLAIAVGRPVALVEVRLAHRAPRSTREHRRAFGVAPVFGADRNELAFDAALLDAPLAHADPTLAQIFERLLARMLERMPAQDGLVAQVRERVARELRGGVPDAAHVARALGLSARTLQRRLADEGATYRGVVDELRRELALGFVEASSLTVDEIAAQLGYADGAAFHRAFRRWTGATPAARRRRRAA